MSNNPVNVEELGSGIGTKRAAAAIAFRDAVERRGVKTVGKHMEKIIDDCQAAWTAAVNVTATTDAAARKGLMPSEEQGILGTAVDILNMDSYIEGSTILNAQAMLTGDNDTTGKTG